MYILKDGAKDPVSFTIDDTTTLEVVARTFKHDMQRLVRYLHMNGLWVFTDNTLCISKLLQEGELQGAGDGSKESPLVVQVDPIEGKLQYNQPLYMVDWLAC